jgi:hypothetical protein
MAKFFKLSLIAGAALLCSCNIGNQRYTVTSSDWNIVVIDNEKHIARFFTNNGTLIGWADLQKDPAKEAKKSHSCELNEHGLC